MTDYATIENLRDWLGVTDVDDEPALDAALTAAKKVIDGVCGRTFDLASTTSARTYYPTDQMTVLVDDIATTSGLVVKTDTGDDGTFETTWAAADYQLEPLNGVQSGQSGWPYWTIRAVEARTFPTAGKRPSVEVTAQWGWATIPDAVKQATLIQAARIYRRRQTPEGFAAGEAFGAIRVSSRIDPEVEELLAPYRRIGGRGLVVG